MVCSRRAGRNSGGKSDLQAIPVIPDHEILRLIGRGSYGEVWLARSVLGTLRAVKVVRRAEFDSPRPFEREFHGIQRFEPVSRSHEGLVDILQVGRNDADGYFYYIMELADPADPPSSDFNAYRPRTLGADLTTRGRLPAAECVELFHSLGLALAHLHGAGLVHRDIKPANIIYVGGTVKFADIGLVSAADETGSFVGTEGFIPPEGSGTAAADIYSLGKVLYEAATGRDRKEFPALPLDAADLSANSGLLELNAVIVKACAAEPAQRHATAAAFAEDLGLLREGKSVKALRQNERRRAFGIRFAPVAVVIFTLLLAIAFTLHRARETRGMTPAAPSDPGQAAAELLARARRMRGEAAPGWRSTALDLLARAAALKPSDAIRQEAVSTLAAADLRPLSWTPPGPAAPLLLDLAHERYVTATPEGVVVFRSLWDHAELFRHDVQTAPLERFVDFSSTGHWLSLLCKDGTLRFRRCDPGTGAWLWFGRENGENHAAFNLEGNLALYTFSQHVNAEHCLTLSPTADMGQKRYLELPGRTGPFAWSPDDGRLAVLIMDPPGLAIVEVASGIVAETLPLEGTPTALVWLDDSSKVLCGTRKGIFIAEIASHRVERFTPNAGGVTSLALDESHHLLATTGADGRLRTWDAAARRELASVATAAERVGLSSNGRHVVGYSAGQTRASLWEFANPQDLVRHLPRTEKPLPAAPNMAGLRLEARAVWVETDSKAALELPAAGEIKYLARTPDGERIQMQLTDGGVQEWNLPRLKERPRGRLLRQPLLPILRVGIHVRPVHRHQRADLLHRRRILFEMNLVQ